MSNSILFEGCNYVIQQEGDGEVPIVLLHGFCFDQTVWSKIVPELSHYRLLYFDHSGMGLSTLHVDHSISKMAELILAILNQLQIEQCFLIGHSMGGYIAANFAARYPERLLGLTMMNSHPFEDSVDKKDSRQKTMAFMGNFGAEKFVQQLIPSLFTKDYTLENPQMVQDWVKRASSFDTASIIACQKAMIDRTDLTAGLKRTRFPIQFIIGKHDQAIAAELNIAQTILPEISCVTYLKSVAHMAMLEAPQEVAVSIDEFIQSAKCPYA